MTKGEEVRGLEPASMIVPKRRKALGYLSEEQYEHLFEQGYLAVPGVVPMELCSEIAGAVREFVGADDARPVETWYENELDIYSEVTASGKKPHHGPSGMVQMYHHASLWKLRQLEAVHACFTDVYGTEKLWVTTDRAHFKPPARADKPKWSDAGPVHSGLHWDLCVDELPVPFAVQGLVYLEDTRADQGALRVVPGSHTRLAEMRHAPNRQTPTSVQGDAGTLVLWLSATLHGPGPNVSGTKPRVSAYVAMLPVDAQPYQPPGRRPDAPLSLADAGTLDFDDAEKRPLLTRLDRAARVDRWRARRPLLNEDPRESDLDVWPPGEVNAPPFPHLSPLGRKLVGLDEWH